MRIAIYSDVHGNYPALKAFMKHSVEKNVNCYEFLGDAVNYGGKPQECLDEIIKLGLIGHIKGVDIDTDPASFDLEFIEEVYASKLQGKILLGNNDAACCHLEDPDYFSTAARESALITRDNLLSEWHKAFLRERPMEAPMNICNEEVNSDNPDKVIPVRYNHSAPGNLSLGEWHYVKPETNIEHIESYFDSFDERIVFVGHSHIPCAFVKVNKNIMPVSFPMPTKNYDKAIVNVGAIGQPRYGHKQGAYVIVDSITKTIELEWFDYDIQEAVSDIIQAKLPIQNAQRLKHGRVIKPPKLVKKTETQI
jgi:predicted phosphodiesterase